jgi:metalloendopeptidase OMA1, mitochondrial
MKTWAFHIVIRASILTLCALVFSGCETVPETGRSQFNIVSSDEETKLGVAAFQDTKQKTPISKDAQANAMVQRVGQKIASVANLPNAQWEFVVFESTEANAWCLPGGKVGVYTGILPHYERRGRAGHGNRARSCSRHRASRL